MDSIPEQLLALCHVFTTCREKIGVTYEPDDYIALLSAAMKYQADLYLEISWNFQVYAPLLSAVFRPSRPVEGLTGAAASCNWIAWYVGSSRLVS